MLQIETDITRLLSPDSIRVGLPGRTKGEVLDGLIATLEGSAAVVDLERARQDVLVREDIMSTGVGQGLGLPHAKTPGVIDTVAAFAVTRDPIDYRAIDDRPVRLLFLLLGPESSRSQHIKILSRISRLMNREEIRNSLLAAENPEKVLEILSQGEFELLDR